MPHASDRPNSTANESQSYRRQQPAYISGGELIGLGLGVVAGYALAEYTRPDITITHDDALMELEG